MKQEQPRIETGEKFETGASKDELGRTSEEGQADGTSKRRRVRGLARWGERDGVHEKMKRDDEEINERHGQASETD